MSTYGQQDEAKTHYVLHLKLERVDRYLKKVQGNTIIAGPKEEVTREVNEVTSMTVKGKTSSDVIQSTRQHLEVIEENGEFFDV